MFIGIPRGEEFLGTLHPLFTTLHPGWFSGGCVISLWFTLFLLLKEIGYVVETVSIFGRTTAVVRLHSSRYAHAQQVMCMRWPTVMHPAVIQTYDAPSSGMPSGFALQFTPVGLWNRWRVVKSGWRVAVNSSPLGMPINTGGAKERWRVKSKSMFACWTKKWGANCFHERNRLRPWYFCLWVNEHPKIRTCR